MFCCSCNLIERDETKTPLAKVGEEYLYLEDLIEVIPEGLNQNDSTSFVRQYMTSWIRQTLLVKQAEANLTHELEEVEKKIKDYRNSLVTYAYEKELIQQKLDTNVSEKLIEQYYNENKKNFELKDNIIKVLYVKLRKDAPNIDKVKKWYTSEDPKLRQELEDYCHQYASNYYFDDNTWLLFDDLLKEIPIQTYNKELFLKNNRYMEVSDSSYRYFVNIKGFQIKNSISPLAFERENIKNIVINKRKLELINKMREDIYQDALKKKKIEIF